MDKLMSIKALFFDIDGTLVSFKTHKIPASTIDALTAAKANGLQIYIATGRPLALINNLGEIAHLVDGYLAFNGAYCCVGEQDVLQMPIPTSDVETLLSDAVRKDYCVLVCGKKRVALFNEKQVFTDIFIDEIGVNGVDFSTPIDDVLKGDIFQMTPFFSAEDEAAILTQMPDCVGARWHAGFTDLTVRGADKGATLLRMVEHLGLRPEETMAFGDGGNDMTMLSTAGVGVAMGNAMPNVKTHADYVTTSVDEDGIRNALQHFGLIENLG